MGGLGIDLNFSLHDGDKVSTRDAHCGHHNEHLKKCGKCTKKFSACDNLRTHHTLTHPREK